jgi:hypothetical protein
MGTIKQVCTLVDNKMSSRGGSCLASIYVKGKLWRLCRVIAKDSLFDRPSPMSQSL